MAFAESKKPLKVFAEILELSTVKKAPPVLTSPPAAPATSPRAAEEPTVPEPTVPSNNERQPPALHQAVESIVGVLANAVIGLQAAVPTNTESATETQNMGNDTPATTDRSTPVANEEPQATEEEKEERPWIHGRHTCDACLTTPIVGKRFHAQNMADYDLCQNCFENYKGEEIKFEEVQLGKCSRSIPNSITK